MVGVALVLFGCQPGGSGRGDQAETEALLSSIRERPASPIGRGQAEFFDAVRGGLEPRFSASNARVSAKVVLPERAHAPIHVEDAASGASVEILLSGSRNVIGRVAAGYMVYPAAHESRATLLHEALPDGLEDFLSFEDPPATAIRYELWLGGSARALRLVANTLEVLDDSGAPRLRVTPPYIVGADGATTGATLAVEGCAVDTSPAPPWDRPVTAPGAQRCTLHVSWENGAVRYPAVLDPRWTTTGSMATARQGHTATVLSTGKVLVAGGSNGSTALASAELYDRSTGTWAATGSMTGARQLHSATQLGTSSNSTTSGKVLVAGGVNGTTTQNAAQLYSPTAGTWTAAANLNAARHAHTATLLADGRVLVAGGLNGTTTLQTAALYNPASGTGSWAATTGPIPPPALKNHTATLLVTSNGQLNNKVLFVGGNSGTATLTTVFLFDPTQSAFSTLAFLSSPREGHTATVLPNGKVLVAGGKNGSTVLATAIVFDPSSGPGSWSSAGTMTAARIGHTATLLPAGVAAAGQVVVAGGSSGSSTLSSAELFSNTSTWTATAAMPGPAQGHTASVLANGAVLIAGGVNGTTTLNAARLYDASSGLTCTSNAQCTTGFCVNGVCCDTACTNQCMACNLAGSVGTCSAKSNGTTCNDSNACTQTDQCQAGNCMGSNSVVCSASDTCHLVGTCNTTTGTCSNPQAPNGTVCSDGNGCTQTDACQAGVCQGSNPKSCPPIDQCHLAGTCSPSTGNCSTPNKTNGTACNDGTLCTQVDTCQAGVCQGSQPVVCPAATACHLAGTCDPANGNCTNPTAPDGAACNDGDFCTDPDTCLSGSCVAGGPVTCVAPDSCHFAGGCVPATGCVHNPVPDNTPCNDGSLCTDGDSCQSGTCTGTPQTCPCHASGSCDPSTGACSGANLADGTNCDDHDLCTQSDKCEAGSCKGGTPKVCTALDQCHKVGLCSPTTGVCSDPAQPDETPCNDGNLCTRGDICVAGSCTSGPAATCVAEDICHLDGACDPATGSCTTPASNDPSCGSPPVTTAEPQGTPGGMPHETFDIDGETGTLTVARSNGMARPDSIPPTTIVIPALVGATLECVADINSDGANDIVFAKQSTGTVQYLRRLDPQGIAFNPTPVTIDAAAPSGLPGPGTCGDVDGDGEADIVTTFAAFDPDQLGALVTTMVIYRSPGVATQRIVVPHGFPPDVVVGGQSLADFDGDGKPDLAVYAANNQPLLDSQLFVFPNGGLTDLTTSGVMDQPFSQTTRVSVPGTNVLASAQRPNWGAIDTIDWDGDNHPDLWALGNTGALLTFRSLGGFTFDTPELGGVVGTLNPKFTIGHVDGDLDGIPDLLVGRFRVPGSGPEPDPDPTFPKIFPGLGGGTLIRFPLGPTFTHVTVSSGPHTKPLVITVPATQPEIGLVKGTPLVTSVPDNRGGTHPSILMQSVDGHLVERVEYMTITTTTTTTEPPGPTNPGFFIPTPIDPDRSVTCVRNGVCTNTGAGFKMQPTTVTRETQHISWTWIDHGVPSVPVAVQGQVPHETIVDSQPAAAIEDVGAANLKRRIFVKGLDGHLWELDQQDGTEVWVDDGLPLIDGDPTKIAFPMVGAPSVIADVRDDGRPNTSVFVLDSSGRLDMFHEMVDSPAWRTAGPIGSNNCFGSIGSLGDGSPRAISFLDGNFQRHHEVFVVSASGDLFSWRDGQWEEILDTQYGIQFSDLRVSAFNDPPPPDQRKDVIVCPNSNQFPQPTPVDPNPGPFPPTGPTIMNFHPKYSRPNEARGTPAVAVWKKGNDFVRSVFVRTLGGSLAEYKIVGDLKRVADLTKPTHLDASQSSAFNAISVVTGQTATPASLTPPFCVPNDGALVLKDTIQTDPVVLQDDTYYSKTGIFILATDVMHRPVVAHRLDDATFFGLFSFPVYEWAVYPIPANNIFPFGTGLGSSVGAILRVSTVNVTPAGGGPGPVPTIDIPNVANLDIFAIPGAGVLTEGFVYANPDAGFPGRFTVCDPDPNCSSVPACNGQPKGGFQWGPSVMDHTPPVAPPIIDNAVSKNMNPSGAAHSAPNCKDTNLLDIINPAWVSPQRSLSAADRDNLYQNHIADGKVPQKEFTNGYEDDVMIEVEGVVVDSHVAAIDTPTNHTHGAKHDIPRVHHDWNLMVALDKKYQNLLTDANMMEGGVMELEWELADHLECVLKAPPFVGDVCLQWKRATPLDNVPGNDARKAGFTVDAIPAIGDRIAVRGRFIFDCGHPPYRAEIHPIDAIAVIHGKHTVKFRTSDYGGTTWYQPGDVNLPDGAVCDLQGRLADAASEALKVDDVPDWVPFGDTIEKAEQLYKAYTYYEFVSDGCVQYYDDTLISPNDPLTSGPAMGLSRTCYYPYQHQLAGEFVNAPRDLNARSNMLAPPVHVTLSPLDFDGFTFQVPGGPSFRRVIGPSPIATTVLYNDNAHFRRFNVCFDRQELINHDNIDASSFCIFCCDDNIKSELVTYITAGDQVKLFSPNPNDSNCLQVNVFDGETLTIGSKGFECDFSCGERWQDSNFAMAPDSRTGFTKAALEPGQLGLVTSFTLFSQPDLETHDARGNTHNDYKMNVTIQEL